jgi:hypothetical protein
MRVENPTRVIPHEVIDVPVDLPACTVDEDTFALAVVESGGNVRAAYALAFGGDEPFPVAKANRMLLVPQVAKRVRDLTQLVDETTLISLSSHLGELADIRDLAKSSGQLKTALAAEVSRGTAVGFYKGQAAAQAPSVAIQINMASKHDVTI